MTISILGTMLSANVIILSTKFPINTSKLALSSAIPVNKFCHADFIALADPDIVTLASRAVVPNNICASLVVRLPSFIFFIASSYDIPISFATLVNSASVSDIFLSLSCNCSVL